MELPLLLARKCDSPLHSPLIYSVHGEGIPDLDFAISGLAVYEIEILSFLVLFSLISRVSDPDSGVFWIRIRNPESGSRVKMLNDHNIILLFSDFYKILSCN